MSIKTNKSFAKRLKISKKGVLRSRKAGQNHFNAKENNAQKGAKKRNSTFSMSNKDRSRFIVNF